MTVFFDIVKDYTQTSTIHGINYVSNEASLMIARIFWFSIMLISLLAFTYYSLSQYLRWKSTPIVLGFDESLVDVFEIPLPAVSAFTT
jgi:hypothetical protein